jgi:hypothetical protein
MMVPKPVVFVGSSAERLPVAHALQAGLEREAHVNVWDQGVFRPSAFALEALEEQLGRSDFAILVLGDEDVVMSRGRASPAPRDNVVLEAGIFIGGLGRRRSFVLYDRTNLPKLPTDLLGLTPLTYEHRDPLVAAVGPACEAIRHEMAAQGRRDRAYGTMVAHEDRGAASTAFASQTLRSISIFGGDISWLDSDLSTYKGLLGRNVQIRVLTDTPGAPVIGKAKRLGVLFRQYPAGGPAPLKASITDADEEGEARALVVRRTIPATLSVSGAPYRYWMRVYRGPADYPVIRAMSLLFEDLFAKGKPL